MTQIDVYGVGNALVDKEFEVDEAFFTDYGINKGVMTLVTHDRQDQLLKVLTDIMVLKKSQLVVLLAIPFTRLASLVGVPILHAR